MAVRKHHASWWVDFMYRKIRYRKRSPENSRTGAELYEGYLRRQLAMHGTLDVALRPNAPKPSELVPRLDTFAERWLREYVNSNNKPSEQKQKRYVLHGHLIPVFGRLKLLDITNERVEHYKTAKLQQGLSAKTINNQLTILRRCLTSAVDWNEIQRLPKIQLLKAKPSDYRFLTAAQAKDLIAMASDDLWRAMIVTALRTGLRFSELVALEWSDINWDTKIICVQRANVRGAVGTPKNNRVRYIPMAAEVVRELQQLPRTNPLVFSIEGTWVRYNTALRALKSIGAAAGLPNLSWHDLRHTFASQLAASGASLKAIQDLMGHSTIEMTMRYSHLNNESLREAIALLEPSVHHETSSIDSQISLNNIPNSVCVSS